VVGESAAGHPYGETLQPGQAVRISTGALMPAGASAVLVQENALRTGDDLALNGAGDPSPRHIRRTGFDFTESDELLAAGTRLGPAQIALAYAAGHATVSIHRAPRLVAIDTGAELSSDPENCAPHQIPMSNGAMIAALARPFVDRVKLVGAVPDHLDTLTNTFASCEDADVIVTTGGASVGDHDLVRPALEAWGATIDVWRVAIKPGKPVLVARRGETLVLGLPGNPVSSFVTAYLFLLPLLRRLGGAAECLPRPLLARTTRPLPPGSDRQEFVRARLDGATVTPLGEQDSSALRTLAAANALIQRPIGAPAVPEEGEVRVYIFESAGIA
jgi:molybdopterin molybdotransferase